MSGKSTGVTMAVLLAAGLAIGSLLAAGHVRNKIERAIEEKLSSAIGPAQSYNVKVDAGPFSLMHGKMNSIKIDGKNVLVSSQINVDDLHVTLKGVVFNSKTSTVTNIDESLVEAEFSENSLNKYLINKYQDISEISITLKPGQFAISGKPLFVGLYPTIRSEGSISIVDRNKLFVSFQKLSAVGVPVPGFMRSRLENRLNPIFNTDELGFDVTLKNVIIEDGNLKISGEADLVNTINRNLP